VSSAVGGTANVLGRSAGAVGGLDAAGRLTSDSRGVFGLKDTELSSAASGGAEGTLITSAKRNVRLDRGTRMLLVTGANAAGSGNAAASNTRGLTGSAQSTGALSGAADGATHSGTSGVATNATGAASGSVNAAGSVNRTPASPNAESAAPREQTNPR
jgi:hypothetical protein